MISDEYAQITGGKRAEKQGMTFKSELTQLIRKHLTDNPDAKFGDYMQAATAMEEAKHEVDAASDTRFSPDEAIAWEDLEIAKTKAAERFARHSK